MYLENLLLFSRKVREQFCKNNTGEFTILYEGTTISYFAIGQEKTSVLYGRKRSIRFNLYFKALEDRLTKS